MPRTGASVDHRCETRGSARPQVGPRGHRPGHRAYGRVDQWAGLDRPVFALSLVSSQTTIAPYLQAAGGLQCTRD